MSVRLSSPSRPAPSDSRGSTLIETVIATSVMLVLMLGLLGLTSLATVITENEGHLTARTTEYAQDKMEQLLALKYGDTQSDTTAFPAATSGGTGLAVGGSSDPASPTAKYVDYLDTDGTLLTSSGTTAPASWFYKRVWKVQQSTTNLKQVTVTTAVKRGVGNLKPPQSTVTAYKVYPF
jgi:Tfp pilus assembly protein PilV